MICQYGSIPYTDVFKVLMQSAKYPPVSVLSTGSLFPVCPDSCMMHLIVKTILLFFMGPKFRPQRLRTFEDTPHHPHRYNDRSRARAPQEKIPRWPQAIGFELPPLDTEYRTEVHVDIIVPPP